MVRANERCSIVQIRIECIVYLYEIIGQMTDDPTSILVMTQP